MQHARKDKDEIRVACINFKFACLVLWIQPPQKHKHNMQSLCLDKKLLSPDILTPFSRSYALLIALLYTVSAPITLLWDYNVNVLRIVTITVSGGVIFSIKWGLCVLCCCIFLRPVIGWKRAFWRRVKCVLMRSIRWAGIQMHVRLYRSIMPV